MAGPAFGFSVGDFIAELVNLERALTEVRYLKVDASQLSQKFALEQVSSQCEETIEDFLKQNTKFSATLGIQSRASKWNWRANLHKIQWGLCKDDAIAKLRSEIMGHTLTINTLLATIHLSTTALDSEAMKDNRRDVQNHRKATDQIQILVQRNNDILNTQADLMLSISKNVTLCSTQQQTENLQAIMLKVLATNMKIYLLVIEMQNIQGRVPLQVNRQLPVYFEDAHGRIAPFHVEFINSFEAFQAVMKVRFRHVPGLKKVKNMEYTVQESMSRRKLNLYGNWESVFLPGRKVNMSVVFHQPQTSISSCPGCRTENEVESNDMNSEIQCANQECKMWYSRIIEIDQPQVFVPAKIPPWNVTDQTTLSPSTCKRKRQGFEQDMEDLEPGSEDEIHQFRRVHIVCKRMRTAQALTMQQSMEDISIQERGAATGVHAVVTDTSRLLGDGNMALIQPGPPQTLQHSHLLESQLPYQAQVALQHVDKLKFFLISAPVDWTPDQYIKRFLLPTGEYVSCVVWNNSFHISGTDIIRCLSFRFQAFGRQITNSRGFEEGVFKDLRNPKSGVDASTEEAQSPFLDFLYKNYCVRTLKKQKVFYWYSVPHDRLFLDALERDMRREACGTAYSRAVDEPALSFKIDTSTSLFEQLIRSGTT